MTRAEELECWLTVTGQGRRYRLVAVEDGVDEDGLRQFWFYAAADYSDAVVIEAGTRFSVEVDAPARSVVLIEMERHPDGSSVVVPFGRRRHTSG